MDVKMTKVLTKIGVFYIKHKVHESEARRIRSSDILKCYNENDQECTIFNKEILSKMDFIIIN